MRPTVHACNWGPRADFSLPFPLEIWFDQLPSSSPSPGRRILILGEPEAILGLNAEVIERAEMFDHILTFDPLLLDSLPNAKLFEFGTTWIDPETSLALEKEFSVSFVCGNKAQTEGHLMRHWLWDRQHEIRILRRFFGSDRGSPAGPEGKVSLLKDAIQGLARASRRSRSADDNPKLGDSKLPLFESMFHVAIENSSSPYYFTEKIVDSLICRSVPIYWGCTRIDEYFNIDGIIRINDSRELIPTINRLTVGDYEARRDAIEENRERALEWVDYEHRLESKVRRLYSQDLPT